MKIAHIVCTYPPYYGGMGNVVFQTVEHLLARGHDVEVFTPQYEEPDEETVTHVRRIAPQVSYGNAAYLPSLGTLLDRFDIVHLHYPFFGIANIVRRWRLRNKDKRLVVTYHMDNRGRGMKGLFFDIYRRFWMPRILTSADALFVSSFDYVKASDARQHFVVHKSKWHELPFGVDVQRFFPQEKPVDLFEQWTLDTRAPTVLFVGGMDDAHQFKDIPTLLNALAILKEKGIRIQGIFVGEGNLREPLSLRARGLGLAETVRFVGAVPDEDLPRYYAMGDVLALPSMHRAEAFGMVLLEAYASGLPIIATDLPGVRSVAQHAGILVPPKDYRQLANMLEEFISLNVQERLAFARRARHVAETVYAWDPIIHKLEEMYFSLAP